MDIIKIPVLHKRDDKQQALNGKRISVELLLFSHSPRKHHIQLLPPLQLSYIDKILPMQLYYVELSNYSTFFLARKKNDVANDLLSQTNAGACLNPTPISFFFIITMSANYSLKSLKGVN